jgi:signal transduction histidine kinase
VTSVIAHQLKTPLAGLKSALEVLLAGQLGAVPPAQEEYLRIALEETERMIAQVRDLLDAAHIDERKFVLSPTPVDFAAVVRQAMAAVEPFARAKNTTLSLTVEPNLPTLSLDGPKLQQAVSNVIDNAIRYNRGRGRVALSLRRVGRRVVFACRDSGIGIGRAEAKHLFTKFYRAPAAVTIVPSGSGLGLYIARAIVEQSGGRLWFESVPGQGTTFYLALPVQ